MPVNDGNQKNNQTPLSDQSPNALPDPRARRLFVYVAIFAAIAVVFGGINLYNSIRSPFAGRVSLSDTQLTADQAESIDQLRYQDTDGDSLSDYDELYRYNTSPYLSDSDSDGISDTDEINANTDPNCPEGKDCAAYGGLSNTNSGVLSAEQLRKTLANAGAPQYILDSTSDEDLLALYQQVAAQQTTTDNTNVSSNTNSTGSIDATDLASLTPTEIRQLLLENGVDQATIDALDDETLQSVFLQAIQEEFGSGSTNTNSNN